jgi:hypothetical protein
MTTEDSQVTDEISVSDLVRKCFSAYELKDRRIIEDLLSDDSIRKLINDRLKALRDQDINALLSNHMPDIRWRSLSVSAKRRLRQRGASACAYGRLTPKAERESILQERGYANDVIDPEQYTGADTFIAREMNEIITFA